MLSQKIASKKILNLTTKCILTASPIVDYLNIKKVIGLENKRMTMN
jgi:hypothetical protein